MHRPRVSFASLVLAVLASGCAPAAAPPSAPVALPHATVAPSEVQGVADGAPPAHGPAAFVDLADGRHSELFFTFYAWFDGAVDPEFVDEWVERYDIVGERVVDGVTYRVEETTEGVGDPTPFETLYRQDRSGLFVWQEDAGPLGRRQIAAESARARFDLGRFEEALAARGLDVRAVAAYRAAAVVLAARYEALETFGRPGGPGESEITFLRYPLRPGASWEGREGFNVWTVEGREWLDTPVGRIAAWRLNIRLPEFFGPNDRYLTWWAAPGEVKRRAFLETEAVDENGNPIGILKTEQQAWLLDYEPGS